MESQGFIYNKEMDQGPTSYAVMSTNTTSYLTIRSCDVVIDMHVQLPTSVTTETFSLSWLRAPSPPMLLLQCITKSPRVCNSTIPQPMADFFNDISLWRHVWLTDAIMLSQRSKYKEFVHHSYGSRSRTTDDGSMCPEPNGLSPYLQNKRGKAYTLDHDHES